LRAFYNHERLMRVPSLLTLTRVLAWGAGYGAAFVVAYNYEALPDELPLSRWTVAQKSMFFAVRVPLIHIALLGLCELLARSARRVTSEHRQAAERAATALLCTAGAEAWLVAKEILLLPGSSSGLTLAQLALVGAGLSVAVWHGRPLLESGAERSLHWTRFEQVLCALLLATIVALNLPLVAPHFKLWRS
jgi:hypothetical protein